MGELSVYGVSFCCDIGVEEEEEVEVGDGIGGFIDGFINMVLYDDTVLLPTSTGATLSS